MRIVFADTIDSSREGHTRKIVFFLSRSRFLPLLNRWQDQPQRAKQIPAQPTTSSFMAAAAGTKQKQDHFRSEMQEEVRTGCGMYGDDNKLRCSAS